MRLRFFIFLISFFSIHLVQAQICGGNKGLNIFTDGDFGSGIDNIRQSNPGIAPGYQYVFSPPVDDGQYCLTNDLAPWTEINGWGWMRIQDDSPDPDGYMLLVNASYDTGLFYQELVTGLCENSLFEFTARIFNLVQPGSNKIKPNVSFLIDGVPVYSTGDIPENGRWNTYGFTFTTAPGQTQVTLALRNNAPGGIGNDLAIDNIKFQACGPRSVILPFQTAFACEDSADVLLEATVNGSQYDTPKFQWQQSFDQGNNWVDLPGDTSSSFRHTDKSGGAYYYRYLLANSLQNLNNAKCRIVSNEKIVRVTPKFTTIRDTICDGLSRDFGLNSYSSTGRFTDSLITFFGCDSIVTLDLEVLPDRGIETEMLISPPRCVGTEDGSVNFTNIFDGTAPFILELDGDTIDQFSADNLSTGIHSLKITDRYGCTSDTTFEISDPDRFEVDLGADISLELGDSALILTQSNFPVENFSWRPSYLFNCDTNCDEIQILPTESTLIQLNAKSNNDCLSEDSLYIELKEKRDIFIPDVFTPNNDGFNDQFSIIASYPNVKKVISFSIYDRWENRLFHRENLLPFSTDLPWSGAKAPSGVYFYHYKLEFLDNEIIDYTGFLHLLR